MSFYFALGAHFGTGFTGDDGSGCARVHVRRMPARVEPLSPEAERRPPLACPLYVNTGSGAGRHPRWGAIAAGAAACTTQKPAAPELELPRGQYMSCHESAPPSHVYVPALSVYRRRCNRTSTWRADARRLHKTSRRLPYKCQSPSKLQSRGCARRHQSYDRRKILPWPPLRVRAFGSTAQRRCP